MNKTKVLITIDTEGHDGENPIEKLILGCTKDGNYGIEKIMDELDKVNIKGLFFVDFAECWDYGEAQIKKVVDLIIQRGHNVGVHIHPDHMADKERFFLYEYTYEEQFEIIKKCTRMYQKLVGATPVSFRAGKYSANRDTLEILQALGYKYDFSEFYHQKWCGIEPPITVNAPVRFGKLIEFPVTMHKSISIGPVIREDKLDIEYMTIREFKYAFSQIKKQRFDMVAIPFLHSFSLLKWREFPDNPQKDIEKIHKLSKAMQYIRNDDGLEPISEADLESIEPNEICEGMKSHIQWKSRILGVYYTYIKAKVIYKTNKKAKFLVYVVRGGGLMLLSGLIILIFIKKGLINLTWKPI